MSCSATQDTSFSVISRPGGLDQKHRTRKRRNARRASRTRTMSRAVAGSRVRRLFLSAPATDLRQVFLDLIHELIISGLRYEGKTDSCALQHPEVGWRARSNLAG